MKSLLSTAALILTLVLAAQSAVACKDKFTFVGVLKSKTNIVEVYSSKKGPHYTVRDATGSILATTIDDQKLLKNFPHLESLLTEGHADSLDASLGIETTSNNVMDELNKI